MSTPRMVSRPLPIRRVVTGHDPAGKAVVWIDSPATNHKFPSVEVVSTLLWSTDATPADYVKNEDGGVRQLGTAPPVGGTRFVHIEFRPGETVPALHRTDTLDYMVVVSGEITLYLDDGVQTVLKAGDVCIQRGTNHAWANHGSETAQLVGVLLDGTPKRSGSLRGADQAS